MPARPRRVRGRAPDRADPRFVFLQSFLKRPREVGSVIPSSRFLERKLVRMAGIDRARTVVELGPGTGGTTQAILRTLPASGRLLAIEIHPRLVRHLREHVTDPRLSVHAGDARSLRSILEEQGLPAPDIVVSGIPFSTMPQRVGLEILEAVRESLAPGGAFVAYQVRDRVETLGRRVFGRPETAVELRNIPPMRLYRWSAP